MLLAVAAAIWLGLWQLGAWQAHREADKRDVRNEAPVALSSLMGPDSAFPGAELGKPVTFEGTWVPDQTLYVAHRELDGKDGFWVVTPVLIGKSAMPVVRGWSATATSTPPSGPVTVTGWLQASEGTGPTDENPHDNIIASMRVASLVEQISTDIYSGYVVAQKPKAPELKQVTAASIPEISSFSGLRNLLYGLQWWVFGGFAVFIWWKWCRELLAEGSVVSPSR